LEFGHWQWLTISAVKDAKKRSKVDIVSLDWIDISIFKMRKLDATEYSFKEKQKDANTEQRLSDKKEKGIANAKVFVNTSKFLLKYLSSQTEAGTVC
jgi:hypothetical protein